MKPETRTRIRLAWIGGLLGALLGKAARIGVEESADSATAFVEFYTRPMVLLTTTPEGAATITALALALIIAAYRVRSKARELEDYDINGGDHTGDER